MIDIKIDADSLLAFAQNNDFVVAVFVIALVLVAAGFIFRTFLKAAIITAIILVLSSVLIQLIPESEGHINNIANQTTEIINQGKNHIQDQINNKKDNLGNITDE